MTEEQPDTPQETPAKKGSKLKLVLGIGGGSLGCLVLVCGGLAFGLKSFFGKFKDALKADLETQSVLVERVGEIESFDLDWIETGKRGDGRLVFAIEGSRADGHVIVLADDDHKNIIDAELVLDLGDSIQLFADGEPLGDENR